MLELLYSLGHILNTTRLIRFKDKETKAEHDCAEQTIFINEGLISIEQNLNGAIGLSNDRALEIIYSRDAQPVGRIRPLK